MNSLSQRNELRMSRKAAQDAATAAEKSAAAAQEANNLNKRQLEIVEAESKRQIERVRREHVRWRIERTNIYRRYKLVLLSESATLIYLTGSCDPSMLGRRGVTRNGDGVEFDAQDPAGDEVIVEWMEDGAIPYQRRLKLPDHRG